MFSVIVKSPLRFTYCTFTPYSLNRTDPDMYPVLSPPILASSCLVPVYKQLSSFALYDYYIEKYQLAIKVIYSLRTVFLPNIALRRAGPHKTNIPFCSTNHNQYVSKKYMCMIRNTVGCIEHAVIASCAHFLSCRCIHLHAYRWIQYAAAIAATNPRESQKKVESQLEKVETQFRAAFWSSRRWYITEPRKRFLWRIPDMRDAL